MTSSSPDLRRATGGPSRVTGHGVLTAEDVAQVRPALTGRELRSGGWTRLGSTTVRGDAVTEHTLTGLVTEAQAAARAQGYATGWAEGRRAAEDRARREEQETAERIRHAEERREAEHRAALAGLARAAAALDEALAATCARVEGAAVELALGLTEALVGHELAVAADPGADAVRRALTLAAGDPVVRVRVAPEEAGRPELATLAGGAAVVADPTLARGDALVETVVGVVDARVSDAVARVREVLLP